MKTALRALLLLCAWLPALAVAGELYVISHPGVALGAGELRDVYLGERQFSGTTRVIPVDNASVQEVFLARVLQIENARYSASWIKKSFREGLNPPVIKNSDAEVIEFVRRTPGAIGYISSAPGSIRVIQKF